MPTIRFDVTSDCRYYEIAVNGTVVQLIFDVGRVDLPSGMHQLTWLGVGDPGKKVAVVGTNEDTGEAVVSDGSEVLAGEVVTFGLRDFNV